MSNNDDMQKRVTPVALVTGANRGIGRAIAQALAEAGHVVAGTSTTDAGADTISGYLRDAGNTGFGIKMNVTDPDEVTAGLSRIIEQLGTPLVLVNNAGVTRDNLILRMSAEEWNQVIDTNLNSVFRLCKACAKGMTKARWGRIVNITSVVASMGNAGQSNYAATKAGVEGFSRALARELGSRNITVNCVAPGFIDTDMTRELPDAHSQALQSQIPLGRFGDASEVAALVRFLCSDSASYITGETVHINGGMYMG
jgi:3-oxoacyl-[acyl-carrier protein] reductase